MVWGTSDGRRHAGSADPDLMVAGTPPPMVECARCETPAVLFAASKCSPGGVGSPDSELPLGWLLLDGSPYCADCARVVAPAARTSKLHVIGSVDPPARHRGCRIGHELALDTVGMRMHGGASVAAADRDEPIHFLFTLMDLDDMITHLRVIRMELEASVAAAKDPLHGH